MNVVFFFFDAVFRAGSECGRTFVSERRCTGSRMQAEQPSAHSEQPALLNQVELRL